MKCPLFITRFRTGSALAPTLVGVWLLAGACTPAEDRTLSDASDTAGMTQSGAALDTPDTVVVSDLEATADTGSAGGSIAVIARPDGMSLRLAVDGQGLPPGAHAWHIHEGACGTDGPIRIALSSTADMEGTAGPLEVAADGTVRTTVEVTGLDRSQVGAGTHSVHIHERPGQDPGPAIACAMI